LYHNVGFAVGRKHDCPARSAEPGDHSAGSSLKFSHRANIFSDVKHSEFIPQHKIVIEFAVLNMT
jgi:hypothetical protein